ncbi:hypothetical protein GQ53DRAFT_418090 [Thozetella sp. PMI_491]|nr:hypothetical protein GQ53DRAFT_418090 [Thozetella sp. PMI_491]
MEKAAPPAHDAVSGTTNMPKTRPIIVDNRYPAKSPLDRRPIELPANSPPASPARPVPSNARADRHLKMAVLYQRLAQLHTEEAMEMLGQHATSYADEVESTRWVPRQM